MMLTPLRPILRCLVHLPRIVLIGTALLLFAGVGLVLALRYLILPDIGRYHADITAKVSQAIDRPVIIGKIEADWRGIRPHLLFTDVRILDREGRTALVLPRVDNVLSWKTLLAGEVRLYSLEVDQPDLSFRRDPQGLLYIGGVNLPNETPGQITGRVSDADWLLQQARIVVRNAHVTWHDEQRAAPVLELNKVNLIIDNSRPIESFGFVKNSGRRHRFALRALPPPELSGELDVRGDFYGDSFNEMDIWRGQLYTELQYIDVVPWRAWVPLPAALKHGQGALRCWVTVVDGEFDQLTTDLVLSNVEAQLAEELPPVSVLALRGRVGWQGSVKDFEVSTKKLSLLLNNGLQIPPTDFYFRLAGVNSEQATSGEMRANTLELINLVNLTEFLPLETELKQQLAEFAPQGTVSDLNAKWLSSSGKVLHYEIKARFDEMSMQRVGKLPGFSGLSGYVNGSDTSGTLSLNARKLTVNAPQIMPEPLAFNTLTAQAGWQVNDRGMEVKLSDVFVANENIAGNFSGSYQVVPQSRGLIDLTVHLTRAEVNQIARYIPLVALNSKTHDWLRSALLGGQADKFRLLLRGNLDEFPFKGNSNGIFQIQAHATGVLMEYAKGWPRLEHAVADLLIDGKRVQVTAPYAKMTGANLKKISVILPDIASPDLLLQVRGEALDETQHILDFIRQSPVRGYINGFTDGVVARGKGKLTLQVDVPLRGAKPAAASGSYNFISNDISVSDVPVLMKANGELQFTQSSLNTRNATAEILGGPAILLVQSSPGGKIRVRVSGHADMDNLRNISPHPLLNYLHGSSPWEAEITVAKKLASVQFISDLVGLTSNLPAPFSKQADEPMPLRLERKAISPQQDMLSLQYGRMTAKLSRLISDGRYNIQQGVVSFGSPGKWPARDGVWLTGSIPELSLQGWGVLFGTSAGISPVSIGGMDLRVKKISGYGYKADDLRITARNRNGVLFTQLNSRAITGEARWQPQGNGKLSVHVKEMVLAKDESRKGGENIPAINKPGAHKKVASSGFPALDMAVDSITLNGNHFGRLELLAQQQGSDWVMNRLILTNPDGVLTADGKWQMGEDEKTQLNIKLEISNAGNVLARSGYPNSVKQGSGKLEGVFSWPGRPAEFGYATLDGTLKLDTGKGRFLKIEPGVGKLLSILSLQSLPQHITLDFGDVFNKGFTFDKITGTAQITQGVLTTNDLKIDGSAANATMQGQIDLNKETQNLRVRVLPTVGNSMSLLGALAAGPAVGVGVYIANKILQEPLDKLVSVEYNVTGSWAEPNVEKVDRNKPSEPPSNQ